MASQNWHRDRILSNDFAYQVLRETAINEEGSYASQIARELDKGGQEDTTRLLRKMLELDLVKKGKRGKAQYYKFNSEGAAQEFQQLWSIAETFDSFEAFLEDYANDYFIHNEQSTIKEMLEDDFIQGLHRFIESKKEQSFAELEDLYQELIKKREVKESPLRFIETAVKNHQQ